MRAATEGGLSNNECSVSDINDECTSPLWGNDTDDTDDTDATDGCGEVGVFADAAVDSVDFVFVFVGVGDNEDTSGTCRDCVEGDDN